MYSSTSPDMMVMTTQSCNTGVLDNLPTVPPTNGSVWFQLCLFPAPKVNRAKRQVSLIARVLLQEDHKACHFCNDDSICFAFDASNPYIKNVEIEFLLARFCDLKFPFAALSNMVSNLAQRACPNICRKHSTCV